MKYYNKKNFSKKDKFKKEEGMAVSVRNGDVNGALRILKKKLMKDGFLQEIRERSYFVGKGEKKRRAKAAGKRRYERRMEKRELELGF